MLRPYRRHRFVSATPERAEWVRDEIWHPEQRQELRSDGSLVLRVPYHESAELMGEILRHGDAVRVLAPRRLHSDIVAAARAIVAHGRRPTKKPVLEGGTSTGSKHRKPDRESKKAVLRPFRLGYKGGSESWLQQENR